MSAKPLDAIVDVTRLGEALNDGLYVTDLDRRILYWNDAAERITGFTASEVAGRRCADNLLMHVDEEGCALCVDGCPLSATMRDRQPRTANVYLHHKQGHRLPVTVRAQPLVDRNGEVIGAIEVFSDASPVESLRETIARLQALALLDPLTQIPNRRCLTAALVAQLALLEREGVSFGLLFFDVDRFKRFNDEHGHQAGDVALQTVARTMAATVRAHDTVGRWGGEEFLVVLPRIEPAALPTLGQRLCRMVRHSRVHTGPRPLTVTVSGGGTMARSGDTPASVLARADELMYSAKRAGGDRVVS